MQKKNKKGKKYKINQTQQNGYRLQLYNISIERNTENVIKQKQPPRPPTRNPITKKKKKRDKNTTNTQK